VAIFREAVAQCLYAPLMRALYSSREICTSDMKESLLPAKKPSTTRRKTAFGCAAGVIYTREMAKLYFNTNVEENGLPPTGWLELYFESSFWATGRRSWLSAFAILVKSALAAAIAMTAALYCGYEKLLSCRSSALAAWLKQCVKRNEMWELFYFFYNVSLSEGRENTV